MLPHVTSCYLMLPHVTAHVTAHVTVHVTVEIITFC